MIRSEFKVEGLVDARRRLRAVDVEVDKALQRELRQIGDVVRDAARRRAPRRSGKLRRSIRTSVRRNAVSVSAKADHARITEHGGRHPVFGNRSNWVPHPARPFLKPAVDANRSRAVADIERAVDRALSSI